MLGSITPCNEQRHCYYQDYYMGKKACRILQDRNGKAPYKPGKCHFFKSAERTYSGDYGCTPYSPEMIEKIEQEEIAYKERRLKEKEGGSNE